MRHLTPTLAMAERINAESSFRRSQPSPKVALSPCRSPIPSRLPGEVDVSQNYIALTSTQGFLIKIQGTSPSLARPWCYACVKGGNKEMHKIQVIMKPNNVGTLKTMGNVLGRALKACV